MSSYSIYYVNNSIDMNQNGLAYYNYFFVDASSGNINIILPDNKNEGDYYEFQRLDSSTNTVNISYEDINDKTSVDLIDYIQTIYFENRYMAFSMATGRP